MDTPSSALVPLSGLFTTLPAVPPPPLDVRHLWFGLSHHRTWSSLALVPVDPEVSTLPLARGLAQVAASLPGNRVLLVNARVSDGPTELHDVAFTPLDESILSYDFLDFSQLAPTEAERALALSPQVFSSIEAGPLEGRRYSTVLLATHAPLVHTETIPLVRGVDAVALCVRVGSTRLEDIRRLARVIGRELVLGTVALRDGKKV